MVFFRPNGTFQLVQVLLQSLLLAYRSLADNTRTKSRFSDLVRNATGCRAFHHDDQGVL